MKSLNNRQNKIQQIRLPNRNAKDLQLFKKENRMKYSAEPYRCDKHKE